MRRTRDLLTPHRSGRSLARIAGTAIVVILGVAAPAYTAYADPPPATDAGSLATALAAGGTVTLSGDITITTADTSGGTFTIPAGANVVIPSGTTLTIDSGVTLAIAVTDILTVDGTLDNDGTIDAPAGDVGGGSLAGAGTVDNHGVVTTLVAVPADMPVYGNHVVFSVDLAGGTGGPTDAELYGPTNHAVYASVLSDARLPGWTPPTKTGSDGTTYAFRGWDTDGTLNPHGDIPVGSPSTDGAAVTVPLTAEWSAEFTAGGVIPDAYVGRYYSHQLTATGGVPPYQWQFVGGIGCTPLPPGLTLSTSGLLSGTPTVAVGNCILNLSVVDRSATGSYHPVTVTMTVMATPPTCTPATFAAAIDEAADGSTVTLCADLTLDTAALALAVPADRHVTLDLAGHALTATGVDGTPALAIPAGSSLTVIDSSAHLTGTATIDGITDDGVFSVGDEHHRLVTVVSPGTITGTGALTGTGTLQNDGAIYATVSVSGVTVTNHLYLLLIYPNDGRGGILDDLYLYAPTLGDAGISIERDWTARDHPGYRLTGWYTNPSGTGEPLTDATDFSRRSTWYMKVYAGWAVADGSGSGGSGTGGSGSDTGSGSSTATGSSTASHDGISGDTPVHGDDPAGNDPAGDDPARADSTVRPAHSEASAKPTEPRHTAPIDILGESGRAADPESDVAGLAWTGFDAWPALMAAAVLLLSGSVMVAATRRRRHRG